MKAVIIGLFIVFCSFTLNGQVVGISSENMPLDSTDSLFSLHSSMPSRTRGEGFVFSVKTPHDNSCVLSLYKNGMYNIEFFFDASPDVLIEIPLGDELTEIEKMYHTLPAATFHWQQAVTGGNDRIIPPANQLQAWEILGTPVLQTEDTHYQEELFRHYLQDLWTSH